MRKRFGILTYHNANNYGAVLQAYGLQRFIKEKFGEDSVEVIDYQCEGVRNQRHFSYYSKGKNPFGWIVHYFVARNRINKIEKFCRDNMSLSKRIATKDELYRLSNNYDYIISGSDQVWNRKWNGGEDTYLQDFHNDNKKKVSYAASFGISVLPNEWITDYRKLLSDFSYRSVREEIGKNIIHNTLGLESEVHIDPSMLLTRSQWDKVAQKGNPIHYPYVLAYMVPYQNSVMIKAQELAKKYNLKVVVVSKSLRRGLGIYKGTASVEEIIALFRDAEYVVTNSFHGTAFSIIYQKRFYIELNNRIGFNIRSAQLLQKCSIIGFEHPFKLIECIDVQWNEVERILNQERKKAEAYFREMS